MPKWKQRPLAAAMLMSFAAPAAVAQTAPATSQQSLPEVQVQGQRDAGFKQDSTSTGTRTETQLRDIPQFINIVPQEVIRSQGINTMADALRNVPGITMSAPEGGTQNQQNFWIRGFPAGGDIFLDSTRDLGEYNRDLFNVDSVEVLKGPSSLMFGRGSAGGVINEVSKSPFLGSRKEIGLTYGSYNQRRAVADLNFQTSDISAFRLNVLGEDSDSYRDTVTTKKIGLAPSFSWGLGTDTKVDLSYYYLKEKGVTDYGQPTLGAPFSYAMPPVSPRAYYGFSKYDYTNLDTQIGTVKIEHKFNDAVSLKNTFRWANYQREMEATISQSLANSGAGAITASTPIGNLLAVRNHSKSRDNDDTMLINQTELTWKLATGAVKHTLLGGLELGREKLHRWNYLFCVPGTYNAAKNTCTSLATSNTSLLNPDPNTNLNYQKIPNTTTDTLAETVAAYLQDQIEFTPQWKAVFGLRYEDYKTSFNTYLTASGAPSGTPASATRTDRMLSGRAGLIFQPTDKQSYYASWGNSYNPSGELGVYGGTGTNLTTANLNAKPEENQSMEVGTQYDFQAGARVRAAIFRNEKINARVTDPFSGNVSVLTGKQRVDGVELEFAGQLMRGWDVFASSAYMNGKVLDGGTLLANGSTSQAGKRMMIPLWSANLWTVYKLGGGFQIGGGLNYVGQRFADTNNNGRLPEYTVYNAMFGYSQKKYDITLNAYNLSDKKYYTAGYQNNPAFVIPGSPRSFSLTMRYRFD